MYSKITNPKTGTQVSIKSKLGQRILRNYLNVLSGGSRTDGEGGPAERREIRPSLVTPDRMETWETTREHHSSAQTEALRIMAQCVETSTGLKLAALYIPTEESYPDSLHNAFDDTLHMNPADGAILKKWLIKVFTRQFAGRGVPQWWRQTYSHMPTHGDTINIHCSIVMNIIHLILVEWSDCSLENFYLMGATIAAMVLPEDLLTDEEIITRFIPDRTVEAKRELAETHFAFSLKELEEQVDALNDELDAVRGKGKKPQAKRVALEQQIEALDAELDAMLPDRVEAMGMVVVMRALILTIINVDPCCDRDCSHISPPLSARLTAVEDEETQDWSPTNGWVDHIRGREVLGERVVADVLIDDARDERLRWMSVEYPEKWGAPPTVTVDADGDMSITDQHEP